MTTLKMKLDQLVQSHHWLSVKEILINIEITTKHNLEDYRGVYEELQHLMSEHSSIILMIDRHWEDGEPTNLAHAYGFNPSVKDTEPTPYVALEWTSWSKWLGFELDQDTIDEWTELEIICHSLLEMTLDGFSEEEIQTVAIKVVEEIRPMIRNYHKDKLD